MNTENTYYNVYFLWVLLNNLQNPRKHNRISLMEKVDLSIILCAVHTFFITNVGRVKNNDLYIDLTYDIV